MTRGTPARFAPALVVLATLAGTAVAIPASDAAAAGTAKPRPAVQRAHSLLGHATPGHRIDAALAASRGPVDVMLELDPTPASVASAHLAGSRRLGAFQSQRTRIAQLQRSVAGHFTATSTRATKLFAVNAVYDGIAVRTDASRLNALAHLPGVKAVHRLTPKHIDNTVTVPLTKAVQLWRDAGGNTGAGVTIGVIDTGIDYTHKDFGGTGTPAAYQAAKSITDTSWETAKVAGGYDFAGDSYDPSAGLPGDSDTNLADSFPRPDANPLDCNGHGTHVAGTASGLGVTTGGTTYAGSYTDTTSDIPTFESQFSIGPGMAPNATLYALKIFGCGETGTSSDLITQALDWAAAPDGDPNHHLDVVNMSLGADYSPPDDPDAVAADNASLAGVTVVAASGNGGDLFNVGGAPGNAMRAIAVAASDDTQDIVDGLQVDSPTAAQNPATANNAWPAEQSAAFPWASRPAVQGQLARIGSGAFTSPSSSNNSDGCDPLSSADAAAVAGKVAFLDWVDDDSARRCGSATRTDNVTSAGAIGAVFGSDVNQFTAGITGGTSIPAMLTTMDARDVLLAHLADPVTVTLTNALHNRVVMTHPGTVDQVASFSSRGIAQTGLVKPDVTAPGVTVFSAAYGTGADGISFSGTSMATPHVAGEAALVLAAHPSWLAATHTGNDGTNKGDVPLEVKAAIMNTASNPVKCNSPSATPVCSGAIESPNRVGSGRIDAEAAAQTQVIAYDAGPDAAGGVSVSFGQVEVLASGTADVTRTRTVTVRNTGTSAVPAYTANYVSSDSMPGVAISAAPTSTAPIPAGGTQTFMVTLTMSPPQLADRPDPTLDAIPSAYGGIERSFVADESGRLVFTNGTGSSLAVPAYAAPRPVSAMTSPSSISFASSGIASLPLSGSDVEINGTGTSPYVYSVVDAMELQGVSGTLPACAPGAYPPGCTTYEADRAADLKAVGVASDIPVYTQSSVDPYSGDGINGSPFQYPALAYIGIATQQPWRTPADLNEYDVMLDVNGDGLPDAVLFNTRLPGTDIFVAQLDALLQGRGGFVDGPTLDMELLNGTPPNGDETYLFNSDTMTLPFAVGALQLVGFDPSKSTRIRYWVDGVSGMSGIVDSIGDPLRGQTPMSVDIAKPAIYASDTSSGLELPKPDCSGKTFCFSTLNADTTGISLKVVRTQANVAADKPLGVLLIHHTNGTGRRASLVTFATSTAATLGRATAPYGYRNPVTATVSTTVGTATGTVRITEGSATLASASLSNGVAHLTLPVRTVGHHTLAVRYLGDSGHAASSKSLTLTVTKAATTTSLAVSGRGTVTLTATTRVVSPGSGAITGTVRFYDNGRLFATVSTRGTAKAVRRLSAGRHTLVASYGGSGTFVASRGTRAITA